MSELIIKTHNFEKSKNQLKVFSEQTSTDLELRKVDISGGFLGLGDHKVTGYELNSLTSQIQKYLINFNSLHTKFIKEFGQVYNALEALDKDYIQAILIAIKAAEKANNEVKIAQGDITKTIDLQKKTINVLKQFKEKIESYEHLGNVDKLWNDSLEIRKKILSINNDIKNIHSSAKKQIQIIETLNQFKTRLEEYNHLKDIDMLWSKSESFNKEMLDISKKLDSIDSLICSQEQSIDLLLKFKNKLDNYEHLEKIDEIWGKYKTFEMDIITSKKYISNYEEQIYSLKNCLQKMQKQNDERTQTLSKKLKIIYALAGISIGIAIIEFILIMLRII